jgi:hypothetical protein
LSGWSFSTVLFPVVGGGLGFSQKRQRIIGGATVVGFRVGVKMANLHFSYRSAGIASAASCRLRRPAGRPSPLRSGLLAHQGDRRRLGTFPCRRPARDHSRPRCKIQSRRGREGLVQEAVSAEGVNASPVGCSVHRRPGDITLPIVSRARRSWCRRRSGGRGACPCLRRGRRRR